MPKARAHRRPGLLLFSQARAHIAHASWGGRSEHSPSTINSAPQYAVVTAPTERRGGG